MLLLAATASSGALLHAPASSSDRFNRRAALQSAGGALAAAAVAPTPAFATEKLRFSDKFENPQERFEAIRTAAAAAVLTERGSASVFSNKFGKLTLVDDKVNFLYTTKGLCPGKVEERGNNRQFTARLWKPVGTATAQDIVLGFGKGLNPAKVKFPDGFKFYYGAVVKDKYGDELALFANVFEDENGRDAFSELALDFAAKNLPIAELVEKTLGKTPEPAYYYVC